VDQDTIPESDARELQNSSTGETNTNPKPFWEPAIENCKHWHTSRILVFLEDGHVQVDEPISDGQLNGFSALEARHGHFG